MKSAALWIAFALMIAGRAEPAVYLAPRDLLAEMAVAVPDPFAWAAPARARMAPPRPPDVSVPSQVAHLALRRRVCLAVRATRDGEWSRPPGWAGDPPVRVSLSIPSPSRFGSPGSDAADEALPSSAPDPRRPWIFRARGDARDALEAAWESDAVAVRRAYREATGHDWPLADEPGIRGEANRARAARWTRAIWFEAVRARFTEAVRSMGPLQTAVLETAPDDALGWGGANVVPLRPVVTDDPAVNRYGAGFLVRLTADLNGVIPWPELDLSALAPANAPWAAVWLDELVRQGVQGASVTLPDDEAVRAITSAALAPWGEVNVYMPPPSEIGMLASMETAAHEAGAWVALFRAWSALRDSGAWADFVSDDQIAGGEVALDRFRVLVVPAARWTDPTTFSEIAAWVRSGGTLIVSDTHAFSRDTDGADTSAAGRGLLGWSAISPPEDGDLSARVTLAPGARVLRRGPGNSIEATERRDGRGRVLAFTRPLAPDSAFWEALRRDLGIPARPWREAVTTANVREIVGGYKRLEETP